MLCKVIDKMMLLKVDVESRRFMFGMCLKIFGYPGVTRDIMELQNTVLQAHKNNIMSLYHNFYQIKVC